MARNPQDTGRFIVRKRDGILILSLLLVALLFGLIWKTRPPNGGRVCYISYNNEVVRVIPLETAQVFTLEELPHVRFEIRDGRIAFIESDCPDQVCVRTGFIGEFGQFAACLPNRAMIRIGGEADGGEFDAIA